jgi:hypothetical protein
MFLLLKERLTVDKSVYEQLDAYQAAHDFIGGRLELLERNLEEFREDDKND